MDLNTRKEALIQWGKAMAAIIEEWEPEKSSEGAFGQMLVQANQRNGWFTPGNTVSAVQQFICMLDSSHVNEWLGQYTIHDTTPKKVGLVPAGNIPAVGFHDVLCILAAGHQVHVRYSAADAVILPFLLDILIDIQPLFADYIYTIDRLPVVDAVIATGSNNTSRYFEYYFRNVPHIIRKNRNSIAVLSGNESRNELNGLRADIFNYFGLGCRNVSHLFVPSNYDFSLFFEAMEQASAVMQHNKYMNNFDYNQAVYLLNKEPYLTNNFLIVRESPALATPVSVINYTKYDRVESLEEMLQNKADEIQCRVGLNGIPFGSSQHTSLYDYADGIDVMKFLTEG